MSTLAADPRRAAWRPGDAALRRLAYTVFGLCVTGYALAFAFEFLNPYDQAVSWGSGSVAFDIAFGIGTSCFPLVGVVITHRDPRNTIGWLMLAIGSVWAWNAFAELYIVYGVRTDPGSLPAVGFVAALSSWSWVPAIGLMGTFLILLFPDGRLPSPRWRVVGWASAVTMTAASVALLFRPGTLDDAPIQGIENPLGIEALRPLLTLLSVSLVVFPLCILGCAVALVVRFRRSRGVERLQLKWLATAGAFVALTYLVAMTASLIAGGHDPVPGWVETLQEATLVSFAAIPLAIGVAVLKHGLYGIDVVINKAVVFGVLASFITAVYVVIVVGIGRLVGHGDRPNLALSITATAVVAVAFQPVRDRVQRFANRLVYGTRATPYEVMSDFADRMGGTYAAADLVPMMARTVAQGVGARRVDVWLAVGPGLVREATWPLEPAGRVPQATADSIADLRGDRVVPVRHHGDLLGALTVVKPPGEPVTPVEDKLLDDVAAQAGLVLRNARLIDDLRSSRQRLVTTSDEERRRLERNLHDGAQQNLVSVALMLRAVRGRLGPDDAVGTALDLASQQLATAIEELRELARGIHPAILTDRGLAPALRSLAERSPVPVVVDYRLAARPPANIEGTLYFVAAEALANVAKYAYASEVTVRVTATDATVTLAVDDDGVGGADDTRGSGLRGLVDRVSVVDGTLHVCSPRGGGTHLTCTVPVVAGSPAAAEKAPTLTTATKETVGAGS
jgi:signal transduction histidine kinase